ncbi:uncharacterized protein K02A2.6-like [Eupeodes corollae]|uniref:uncharacterized protein K02A2.6-like n=1 Tax=Eupeodes corollae TaxID=290404 RepID=UPI0024938C1A|nr:uncharacterized protein K02A2.6-like [Eupeodes corollae]
MNYIPGKNLIAPDSLSRMPIDDSSGSKELEEEIEAYIHKISLQNIYTKDEDIVQIIQAQILDKECQEVKQFVRSKWPTKIKLTSDIKNYYSIRNKLSLVDDLLLRSNRMIIPKNLRPIMLNKLHAGHLGITKTRIRAKRNMWWPGISKDIELKVKSCPACVQNSRNKQEPLVASSLPDYPWQKVTMDLFKLENKWYIIITDCYSRYFEVEELVRMRMRDVIKVCKATFSRHGVPQSIFTDSGTQFQNLDSSEFRRFMKEWSFTIFTSSP